MEAFLKMAFAVKRRQTIFAMEFNTSNLRLYLIRSGYIKRLRREMRKRYHCDSQHYVLHRRLYKTVWQRQGGQSSRRVRRRRVRKARQGEEREKYKI